MRLSQPDHGVPRLVHRGLSGAVMLAAFLLIGADVQASREASVACPSDGHINPEEYLTPQGRLSLQAVREAGLEGPL
ncbi:hypothetical protein ACFL6M_05130, partial [Candidatus Eisenbacteria bacterium]